MRIKIYYFLSFSIIFIAALVVLLYQGTNNVVNAACVNNCARWVVEPCKDQRGNSCSGGHANCDGNSTGTRYCRVCTDPCDSNPPRCEPRSLDCSNACGQPRRCISDGCGGENCCAATAPCQPTIKPATPTPIIYCSDTKSCPIGQECYQPPMPPCTSGGCIQSMPQRYCRPIECPKRPQGDANCDQLINDADFIVIKSAMKGLKYAALNHSADFNNNNKIDLVDYEIWRNTFKQ